MILSIVVLVALAVRLIYALSLEPRIFWFDGREYSALAESILGGAGYRNPEGLPTAFWPPGYPVFMAGIYALSGVSVTAVRIVQSVLGAILCLLVYAIAARLIGRRPAILAAAITALYPLLIYTAGAVYPVTLQALLIAAVVLLVVQAVSTGGRAHAVAAGLLGGYATLTAASALPAMGLVAVWMFFASDRARPAASRRRGLTLAVLFLVPLLLVVGNWTVRNARVMGSPVLVSANGGGNFWLGNYPGVTASTGNRMTPEMDAERRAITQQNPDEIARDRAFYARGMEHVRSDPGRFVMLSLSKALNLWRIYPQPGTEDRPGHDLERLASILSYGVLLPFAVAWVLFSLRRNAGARLMLLIFLAQSAVHALYISKVRFRLPIDSLVIIAAAGGIAYLAGRAHDALQRRGTRWSWLAWFVD